MIKCDPRAIARCPFKKPCGGDDAAYFMEGSKCDEFNKQVLAPPPTNADRIRAMNDEELADFLAYTWATSARAWQKDTIETLHWLQQPAEEG